MTLRLTVQRDRWYRHLHSVAERTPGLIPVVKGNGYGLGRHFLAGEAIAMSDVIAVGTVHEIDTALLERVRDTAASILVLTPTLAPAVVAPEVILTIGDPAHLAAVPARTRVVVKLTSSMARYGGDATLLQSAHDAPVEIVAVAIHPALAGDRCGDITARLEGLPATHEIWVSHLDADELAQLPSAYRYRVRLGTALWHGDKSMFHLGAEVLQTRPVSAGTPLGYRGIAAPFDGTVVMIGCGSSHGVRPLGDGRSPFHFARRRLTLVEPPHMHTSMVIIADGDPVPNIGDIIDVQHPLTMVSADVIDWV